MILFRLTLWLIPVVCLVLSGCGKKPEIAPAPAAASSLATSAQAQASGDKSTPKLDLSTNDSTTALAKTNPVLSGAVKEAVSTPKPSYPAQDIFEQGLAIVRTNRGRGAAEEAVILFRTAAEKGNPP